ncbi:hypothetical protein ACLWBD_06740 [Bdellovibrio sp. HCB117]|uniref:hypothetical protein n=1 Tax=Bdellovibrio sp. HCB117 TaxID=3394359 RepID=UPI0039B46B10
MTKLDLKTFAFSFLLASVASISTQAKEVASPVLVAQTYFYDNTVSNADDLFIITVQNTLSDIDWDGTTVEMKINDSTVKITSNYKNSFNVVADKSYPKDLALPTVKNLTDKVQIQIPQWHSIKNGSPKISYRCINGENASPWVQFRNPLQILIMHQEKISVPTILNSKNKKDLKSWIDLLLTKTVAISPNLTYSFRASYEYSVGPKIPWVVLPIFLAPAKKYDKADAAAMADAIQNYLNANQPFKPSESQFVFSIIVYQNQLPLLDVQEFELPSNLTELN